jgi:hypothetical protein
MRKILKRLKDAPLYLKIIAAVAAVLVIATVLVIPTILKCEYVCDYVNYVYFNYVSEKEFKYPWVSGGTVVTYVEAPDKTWTLRVSPRTGIFIMPQILSMRQEVYYETGIAKKGKMRGYYNDGFITHEYSASTAHWYTDMNDYFYYEKTDDFDFIKPFYGWNLERPKVTRVVIDEGVTYIGDFAFYRSTNFFGSRPPEDSPVPVRYLESIVIANSVDTIGESAFEGCGSLPSLTIPSGVKYIGERAFGSCYILSPVTIPKSVEYIGERAFEGTVHIDVAADNPNYISIDGVLFNKNKTEASAQK